MNAVDTNILLYSVDRNEPAKQLIAQQLLLQLNSAAEPTLLLWQVLGELVNFVAFGQLILGAGGELCELLLATSSP